MSEFNFEVNGGESIRLKTAGKYCDRDIVVTAESRNPLGLLYTEGAEITAEDWGSANIITNNNADGAEMQAVSFRGTLCKSIVFPDSQIKPVSLFYNKNLEYYDSGNGMYSRGYFDQSNQGHTLFDGCSALKTLWMGEDFLPFGTNAFRNCSSLKEIHYRGTLDKWAETRSSGKGTNRPFLSSGGGSFYLGDSAEPLTEINLTTAKIIMGGAFASFADVEKAIIGETVETIQDQCFAACAKLKAVILKGDTVKTLTNVKAFANTPITSGTGAIYIQPVTVDEATLVAEYQAATNWSTLEGQIKPFSEYTGG